MQSIRTQTSRACMSSHSDPSPGQEGLSWRTEEQEWIPWSSPRTSVGDAESDGELQAFITMRNEADTYTEVRETRPAPELGKRYYPIQSLVRAQPVHSVTLKVWWCKVLK